MCNNVVYSPGNCTCVFIGICVFILLSAGTYIHGHLWPAWDAIILAMTYTKTHLKISACTYLIVNHHTVTVCCIFAFNLCRYQSRNNQCGRWQLPDCIDKLHLRRSTLIPSLLNKQTTFFGSHICMPGFVCVKSLASLYRVFLTGNTSMRVQGWPISDSQTHFVPFAGSGLQILGCFLNRDGVRRR